MTVPCCCAEYEEAIRELEAALYKLEGERDLMGALYVCRKTRSMSNVQGATDMHAAAGRILELMAERDALAAKLAQLAPEEG